ncbi:50S ribosomal protein L27 [Patescibacteria group bacterium]|nr:50S ribosomal protein L27 [Patescibacteria group bacterium]
MAHKKAGGSASNLKDSNAQRLGVKLYAGQQAGAGNIIVKQRGSKFRAGSNVMMTKDDTLMATAKGVVSFRKRKIKKYDGRLQATTFVDVK